MEEESCHKSQASEEAKHEDSNENQQEQLNTNPYRVNISITNSFMNFMLDDIWSCIVVLVVFWLIGLYILNFVTFFVKTLESVYFSGFFFF